MTQWWPLLTVVYLSIHLAASQHHRKELPCSELDEQLNICMSERNIYDLTASEEYFPESLASTFRCEQPSEVFATRTAEDSPQDANAWSTSALFPSAHRTKRGTYSLVNPTFQRSLDDVNLLFEVCLDCVGSEEVKRFMTLWVSTGNQVKYDKNVNVKCPSHTFVFNFPLQKNHLILLAGMQIESEDHTMLIPDGELASLRSVEKLDVICEHVLPKTLSDIRRLTAELGRRRQPLSWQDFERTVLTLVHTTQTLAHISDQHQREAWTDAVMQLFRAIQKDLTPS